MLPGAPEKERQRGAALRIAGAVLFYFFVSLSLVFLNKTAFADVGEDFPLFITWWQFVVSLACIWLANRVAHYVPALAFFPPIRFKPSVALQVLPVSAIFVAMVALNNLCLKYVEVSFYQVARSLTIVFTVVLSRLYLGQRTSLKTLGACAIVISGFIVGSYGEANFSLLGWVYGVISSAFVAAYGIAVKNALSILDDDREVLLIYNTILSILLLLPIIIVTGEVSPILESAELRTLGAWLLLTLAGVFGLLIGIASFLQISLTSPLTHNISGTVKAAVQTILGSLVYGNVITGMNAIGITMLLGGSLLYTVIRRSEMAAAKGKVAAS